MNAGASVPRGQATARRLARVLTRLQSAPGRRLLWHGAVYRSWRILFPVAAGYRRTRLRRSRVVAVVGSFGKTTTARALHAALGLAERPPQGWNAGGFLAVEMLRLRAGARLGVLEVGISRPGTMARYARLIRPDIAVVTSIGSEHHHSLGSLEGTRHEKADMVRALPPSGLAVLNGDDPNALWMRGETGARVVTFGLGGGCDVRAGDVRLDCREGMRFTLHLRGGSRPASSRLVGRPMLLALLAAVAVAHEEGVPLDETLARLGRLDPTPERLQMTPAGNGAWLLVDTYKSFWETILAGLETLAGLRAQRAIVVMGEIEEPRRPQGPLYRDLGARLAAIASRVVLVGSRKACASLKGGASEAGASGQLIQYAGRSPRRAAEIVKEDLRAGDVVWIKGRGIQQLERVAFHLAGRPIPCDAEACKLMTGCATCPLAARPRRRA